MRSVLLLVILSLAAGCARDVAELQGTRLPEMPDTIEGQWCGNWSNGVPYLVNIHRVGDGVYSVTYRWSGAPFPPHSGVQTFPAVHSDGTSFSVTGEHAHATAELTGSGLHARQTSVPGWGRTVTVRTTAWPCTTAAEVGSASSF